MRGNDTADVAVVSKSGPESPDGYQRPEGESRLALFNFLYMNVDLPDI
jgi:hypothetical protein